MATHQVFNQVTPFENINLYKTDTFLQALAKQHNALWAEEQLSDYGTLVGSAEWIEKGHQANKMSPVFHPHDRFGNRIDALEFHPAYHDIMQAAFENKLHSLPWENPKPGAHFARLALNYMHAQNEAGTNCPITMTFSSVPALKKHLPNADVWLKQILHPSYDKDNKPYYKKDGLTIGMAMTEKQGGTDVRANTTKAVAESNSGAGEVYHLTGHKWFCSAPMCDAFLTLAQTEKGVSCFLMPRWLPDGSKNTWYIQRLKDKLGNRSNASSEIEIDKAFAWLVGEEGRGVATTIEMVSMTRYDCMIGSAGLMRRGVAEAIHHCSERKVFGEFLIKQPLMQNVLTDLAIESEAALAMAAKAASCIESGKHEDLLLLRLLLPIGKYWITKRASPMLVEAMECLGGNGYVEQSILPRLYREAPVNAIWEGSGNVQCLDVHRAIAKTPESLNIFIQELKKQTGKIKAYDSALHQLEKDLKSLLSTEYNARILVELLALLFQAAQLIAFGNEIVAEAFCSNRLENKGLMFGASTFQTSDILKRYTFN